jgi:hypothetical protein
MALGDVLNFQLIMTPTSPAKRAFTLSITLTILLGKMFFLLLSGLIWAYWSDMISFISGLLSIALINLAACLD